MPHIHPFVWAHVIGALIVAGGLAYAYYLNDPGAFQ